MGPELGALLRRWRKKHRLSLGTVAARAGIATRTVSGWELGHHQPRLPELEAVLTALDVPPAERLEVLALIDAPRARRALTGAASVLSADGDVGDPPVPGDLLHALRLRRGLTLEEVAREVGASRGVVSRWERSENLPTAGRLQRLLEILGAHPEERGALIAGRDLLQPLLVGRPPSLDELHQRLASLTSRVTQAGDRGLMDLEFLTWQAAIWPLAAGSAGARELLATGWARYAFWLTWEGRAREADAFARRAMDLLETECRTSREFHDVMELAVPVHGLVIAHGTARGAKAAAVDWLQRWLPVAAGTGWEIVLYREMAEDAWWSGEVDAALSYAARACSLAEQRDDGSAVYRCRRERADVLLRSGQPERALDLLSPPGPHLLPFERILAVLQWVAVLQAVGDQTAADWLTEAYDLIERYNYPNFRVTADALARQF